MSIQFNCKNNCIFIVSTFIVFLLILSVFISVFCKFKFYDSYNGIVVNEGGFYYVSCLFDNNEIIKIKKSFLVYEKEKKNYEFVKISDDYVLTDVGPKKLVYINIDLDEKDRINNNVVLLKFGYKSTLFEKFKGMFK